MNSDIKKHILTGVISSCVSVTAALGLFVAAQDMFKPKTDRDIAKEARAASVVVLAMAGKSETDTDAQGSGWFMDTHGDVITANHVVSSKYQKITVILADGAARDAKIIFEDTKNDLTVLKVDKAEGHASLKWGDSSRLEAGDRIIEIGSPWNSGLGATGGMVFIPLRRWKGINIDFMQFDAATDSGNSGGPVVNSQGEVVGMSCIVQGSTALAVTSNYILKTLPASLRPQTNSWPYSSTSDAVPKPN